MNQHRAFNKSVKTSSINTAISRLLVGVVFLITLLYSLLILAYSWMVEDNIFKRQLVDEAKYIQEIHQATGTIVEPRSPYMSLHLDWQGLPKIFQQERKQKPDKIEFAHPDGRTIYVQLLDINGATYVLAADVAGYEVGRDFLPRTLWILVLISIICCAIVGIIALLKARKITRPLNQLAEQVSSQESIEEIKIKGEYPSNEIGILASGIKEAFERLTEAWAREANFTKDVSHEIRTPVAVSRNILTKSLTEVSAKEWQTLNDANLQLAQTTATLLALARSESTSVKRVNVTQLLEHCLLTNTDVNHSKKGKEIEFEIDNEQDVYQYTNENLANILFNNVLSNIVHYTSGKWVSIKINSTQIIFTNSIEQSPPADLLKSGIKGENSQGIGHGLSLIKRIAEVYGWHVSVETSEYQFSLALNFQ